MRIKPLVVLLLSCFLVACEYSVSGCDGPLCVNASSGFGEEGDCEGAAGCTYLCPEPADVDADFLREVTLARRFVKSCAAVSSPRFPNMTFNQTLDDAASEHAVDMVRMDFESIIGSDGLDVSDRVEQVADRSFALDAELAQLVTRGVGNAFDAVDDWLENPADCALLLSDRFSHLGAACETDHRGLTRWSLVLGGAG